MPLVSRTFDQLIDFTRTSAATYVDASGRIVPTAASRNLVTFTQELDNAAWAKVAATVTANAATAPDGTLTGDLLLPSTASSAHYAAVPVTVVTATTYTYSCYVKANGYSKVGLRENAATGAFATFDLSTGAVISQAGGGTGSISSVGNGWFRISMTSASSGTSFIGAVYALDSGYTSGTPFSYTYTGDGTSGVFIWGAQLEAGSTLTDYTRNNGGVYPPRFDYDPVTLAPRGLLVEEQRTNLLTYSEQFDNAEWIVNGSPVITANQTIAPDGTLTADTIAVSGASNGFGVYRNVVSSGTYASSLYFKLMSGAFTLRLGLTGNHSEINCATLAITNTGTGVGSVTAVGNGWYRFVCVGTVSALSASQIYNIGSSTGTLAVWGAQLEAGSFATSYIPTVASQVTRPADVATITGANFSQWYNQSEGTLLVEADSVVGNLAVANSPSALTDGTANNFMRLYVFSGVRGVIVTTGGVVQADMSAAGHTSNAIGKWAFAYKANDFALSVNGAAALTDTSGTVPTIDRLSIGALNSGDQINGHIRSIRYYPTRLSNAQLQALTA